jgi:hypothetical protein
MTIPDPHSGSIPRIAIFSERDKHDRVIDTTGTPEPTLRKPAVVAGVGILLISVLAGLANFGAVEGLVTGGDATKTALDILAAEGLFRLAISAFVLVAVLDAVVAWGLYAFFKPVSRDMPLLAGWLRLAYAAVSAAMSPLDARVPGRGRIQCVVGFR